MCRDTWAAFVSQYGYDAGCDTATVRHDTALGAATSAAACDTARTHGLGAGCVVIQPATRPPMPATRPRGGPRHGQARPATRRSVRAGWARVCTWCTRLSFNSVHCSE